MRRGTVSRWIIAEQWGLCGGLLLKRSSISLLVLMWD